MEFELPDRPAFFPVDQNGADLFRRVVECLAPLPQRHQDREYAASLWRQHIFLMGAAVGGRRRLQDAAFDQRAQPRAEDVLGKAEALLKLAQAVAAALRVARVPA